MFSLDLFHLTPLLDAAEASIIVLAALGFFLLAFEFLATARQRLRSHGSHPAVKAKQREWEEGQGGMSETGLDKKLKSSRKNNKQTVPSNAEAREWGKNAPGEIKQRREKKVLKRRSLYPVKDLKTSELDSSETDELSSSEEEDLEDEAARYEEELHRVILIRFDRGRPPENLFKRIKQKDISMPMHSLMELM